MVYYRRLARFRLPDCRESSPTWRQGRCHRSHPEHVIKALGESPQLLALPLDVRNEAQAAAAAKAAIERLSRIDVLVNNAGYGLLGAVEEASASEVEDQFATNVFGLLNVIRAVLPYMRAAKSGHIPPRS